MSDIAIRVEGLSKEYRIGEKATVFGSRQTLMENITSSFRLGARNPSREQNGSRSPETFWALSDVSFEIPQGEVIGVIGRNGAGKSTLLKILSRITEPTKGSAEIHGRVGSLLEVGIGFHPELTGRENIYLSGAIQGMRRAEIDRKFDEIVEFAETERFIDTPIKKYSSGMYLRLAFAVAAHLEQEILLVDEVLAVGDAQFQRKCIGRMQDVAGQGRTVLFVSHNMAAVSSLCSGAIMLKSGRLQSSGGTQEIIEQYMADVGGSALVDLAHREDREGDGTLRFTGLETQSLQGERLPQASTGQGIRLVISYIIPGQRPLSSVDVAVHIKGSLGELLMVCQASISNETFAKVDPTGSFICTIPRLPLPPGLYGISLWCQVGSSIKGEKADKIENAAQLSVAEGDFYGTGKLPANKNRSVLVDYSWKLD